MSLIQGSVIDVSGGKGKGNGKGGDNGANVAIIRNIHVSSELADEHDAFPLEEGELALVVYKDDRVLNVNTNGNFERMVESFKNRSGEDFTRRAGK